MSRIGKIPVAVPSGVDVTIEGQDITVKGPKGQLSHTVAEPITVRKDEDGTLAVERPNDERQSKALHGLSRTLINNLVVGVTEGYEKKLEIVGVGYRVVPKGPTQLEFALGFSHPVVGVTEGFTKELEIIGVGYRATAQGDTAIELALGFSHPVRVDAPPGITFEVPAPTRIAVKGIDKEAVGQVAANIRKIRKPEPYKGKGVRYAGEVVRRKAGKAAK